MQTIWKYTLRAVDIQDLSLPFHTKILSVANQHDNIVIYALVNPEEKELTRYTVYVLGTGHKTNIDMSTATFLGTVSLNNGDLMFHIFIK